MTMKTNIAISLAIFLSVICLEKSVCQNVVSARQGFMMKIQLNNLGAFGRYAHPGGSSTDTLGLEYPIGQRIEHLFGAGVWVGGKLDTARAGTSTPLRLVSVAYEGWAGPIHEFYPGASPADTIWKLNGWGVPRPPSWNSYWGDAIPRFSMSNNDHYMCYNDTGRIVTGHIPLRLKVIESSFVWLDSAWEGIHIVEYKVINQGKKTIDSSYVGFFVEGDVGYRDWTSFWQKNNSAYLQPTRTGYTNNPVTFGTTPIGLSFLHASRPHDSLRFSFRWFPGQQTPANDAMKYAFLSSGRIDADEYPALSDSRFLLSCGPFTIRPIADTVVVAFAFVSGQSINQLDVRAQKARQLYQTAVDPEIVGAVGGKKE